MTPYLRVAGRALLVAAVTAATQIQSSGETIAWRAVATGAILAAAEVLTPLNPCVGPQAGKK